MFVRKSGCKLLFNTAGWTCKEICQTIKKNASTNQEFTHFGYETVPKEEKVKKGRLHN